MGKGFYDSTKNISGIIDDHQYYEKCERSDSKAEGF